MEKESKSKNLDFAQYEKEISNLYKVMDANQKDEREADLRMVDEKLAQKLAEIGEEELAQSISFTSKVESDEEKPSVKKRFTIPSWIFASMAGFATIVLIGVGAVNWLFSPMENENGTEIATNSRISPQLLTLKPKNITESGYIAQTNEFTLQFEGDVEGELKELINITPAVDFDLEIEKEGDITTVAIKPVEDLQKDTQYTISVAKGAKFSNGSELSSNMEWNLIVEPSLRVLQSYPSDGEQNVELDSYISLDLNQKVSLEELRVKSSISPYVEGFFTSKGNRYFFIPTSKLTPGETYQLMIHESLGNDDATLGERFQISFTTKQQTESQLLWESSDRLTSIEDEILTAVSNPTGSISPNSSVKFTLSYLSLEAGTQFFVNNLYNLQSKEAGAEVIETSSKTLRDGVTYQYSAEKPGVYILQASVGQQMIERYFIKTNLLIVGEDNGEFAEGYVYDAATFAPIADARVASYKNGNSAGTAITNKEGKFSVRNGDIIRVDSGSQFGLLSTYLSPSQFLMWSSEQSFTYGAAIVTDSVEYSQGDTIYFDIYSYELEELTGLDGVDVRVVASESSSLNWFDMGSDRLAHDTVYHSRDGWIEGSIVNNSQGDALYLYVVIDNQLIAKKSVRSNPSETASNIEVDISKAYYLVGENVSAVVKGKGDAQVKVFRRSIADPVPGTSAAASVLGFGELVEVREIELSESNSYQFTPLFDGEENAGYIYTLAISTDQSKQPQYDTVIVYREPYQLFMSIDDVNPTIGGKAVIETKSKNLLDSSVAPNVEFSLEVVHWTKDYDRVVVSSGHEIMISGNEYDLSVNSSTVIDRQDLMTDKDGLFKIELVDLKPGQYDLIIRTAESVIAKSAAIVVEDLDNKLLLYGAGSQNEIRVSQNAAGNLQSISTSDEGDSIIVYGFNQGIFSSSITAASDKAIEFDKASQVACFISKSKDGEISRSCTPGIPQ